MDITSRWHDVSVMPATRSGTAIVRISASWAHRSGLLSPTELARTHRPLTGVGCATWCFDRILITSAGVAPDPTKQDVIDSDFHQRDRGIDPGGGADVAVRVGPGLSSQVASERAGSPGRAGSGGRLAAD